MAVCKQLHLQSSDHKNNKKTLKYVEMRPISSHFGVLQEVWGSHTDVLSAKSGLFEKIVRITTLGASPPWGIHPLTLNPA